MKVTVAIPGHPYEIVIEKGGLKRVGTWLRSLWGEKKVAIISDNHVAKLYASTVEASIKEAGFQEKSNHCIQGL